VLSKARHELEKLRSAPARVGDIAELQVEDHHCDQNGDDTITECFDSRFGKGLHVVETNF